MLDSKTSLWAMHFIDPPQKLVIANVNDQPVYAACANCGEKAAEIAGAIALRDKPVLIGNIAIRPSEHGFYKPCVFCADCLPAEMIRQGLVEKAEEGD